MAMSYGYVYVAQVGMGADKNQLMKALLEAEAYDRPSLIICYAPCINHGIKKGMGKTQENIRDAVEAGYWHLYRYDPKRKEEGKSIHAGFFGAEHFLQGFHNGADTLFVPGQGVPAVADKLFDRVEEDAHKKYEAYKALAQQDTPLF